MVLTVLVLNLYATDDHPVPTWMRDFLLIIVARALGMCETARSYRAIKDASNAAQKIRKARSGAGLNFFVRATLLARGASRKNRRRGGQTSNVNDYEDGGLAAAPLELQPSEQGLDHPASVVETGSDARIEQLSTATTQSNAPAAVDGNELRVTSSTAAIRKDMEHVPLLSAPSSLPSPATAAVDYAKDWKRVAEIVDRLFFWFFLLAITLSTLALFYPLTSLVVRRKTNPQM